jgi:hypothetical protein
LAEAEDYPGYKQLKEDHDVCIYHLVLGDFRFKAKVTVKYITGQGKF